MGFTDALAGTREDYLRLLGADSVGDGLAPIVARPGDAEQVAAALRLADERGIPVYPVGGPPHPVRSGVVLDLSRLDSIVELSVEDTLAVVGAGLPIGRLAEAATAVGLDYPPALAAPEGTTVGGALARGGARSPGWGPDREQVLGLRVALADGRLVDLGSRAIKNQTGYSLTQLVLGGRGALGVIVAATLRLWPRQASRRTLLLGYPSAAAAARAAVDIATSPLPPAAVELLDKNAIAALYSIDQNASQTRHRPHRNDAARELARKREQWKGTPFAEIADLQGAHSETMLLVLVAGADGSEVEERAGVLARLSESSGAIAAPLDEAQARSAWAARRALPSRLALRWPDVGTVEVGIPLDRVEAFVAAGDRLAGESGIGLAIYGGAGLGALGLSMLDGARDQRLRLARLLVAAARAEGGQALDVVGLGLDYDDWLGLVLPDSSAAALRRVRSALDPHGTLQPART